jgi:ParB family chromosome partitioning protein
MSLEQVMAFTLTDDHARQQEVWQGLGWDKGADAIRRALTEGQVDAEDRRARFVGAEAYVAAGGVITPDLFDDENGGYFADPALLDRLVLAKLEQEAQAVRAEGWAWVMVTPEYLPRHQCHAPGLSVRAGVERPSPAQAGEAHR